MGSDITTLAGSRTRTSRGGLSNCSVFYHLVSFNILFLFAKKNCQIKKIEFVWVYLYIFYIVNCFFIESIKLLDIGLNYDLVSMTYERDMVRMDV